MPRDDSWYDEDDEFLDDEFSADDNDEAAETVPCPQCGAQVYEDAEQCPACGTYITSDTSVFSGRPTWWVLLGLLGVLAVILILAFSPW